MTKRLVSLNEIEAREAANRARRTANEGEIIMPEKHPVDPLRDAATRQMSHRGGVASARNEHY